MVWVRYDRDSKATRTFLRTDGDLADAVRDAAEEVSIEAEMIIEAEAFQTGALAASVIGLMMVVVGIVLAP